MQETTLPIVEEKGLEVIVNIRHLAVTSRGLKLSLLVLVLVLVLSLVVVVVVVIIISSSSIVPVHAQGLRCAKVS